MLTARTPFADAYQTGMWGPDSAQDRTRRGARTMNAGRLPGVVPTYNYAGVTEYDNEVGAATGLPSYAQQTGADLAAIRTGRSSKSAVGSGLDMESFTAKPAASEEGGSFLKKANALRDKFAAQKQAASAAPAVSGLGVRVKRDGRVVKKRPGLGEGDSRKRRAVAVKKVMSEHPELSLGQASKFVKENGIKY